MSEEQEQEEQEQEEQNQAHNNFVQEQLSDNNVARGLFQNYLPQEISDAIDWEELTLVRLAVRPQFHSKIFAKA